MPDAGHEVVVLVGGVAVHDAVKVGEVPEMGKTKSMIKSSIFFLLSGKSMSSKRQIKIHGLLLLQ